MVKKKKEYASYQTKIKKQTKTKKIKNSHPAFKNFGRVTAPTKQKGKERMFFKTPQNPQSFPQKNEQHQYRNNVNINSSYYPNYANFTSARQPNIINLKQFSKMAGSVDTLSYPQSYYQLPQQNLFQKQIGMLDYQRSQVQPYLPQKYQNYQNYLNMQNPGLRTTANSRKNFFHMPQAISLGVAFGLFVLGIASWLI